jgi:F0F1-type ATP synthase assembly protein I
MNYKNLHLILGHKVIRLETALLLMFTLVVAVVSRSCNSALSAFLGGVLVLLPTLIYSCLAFRQGLIAYPNVALRRHQKAMVFRFLANFILFALVTIFYRQCNFLLLIIGYFVTISGYWLSLIK